ncbi:hypothetical protein [Allorhizocola rhizosphaerae]|uniref:hypothetical protein n=1 Tax=Allorhizocola rhizosphaerae TaxID=1872709 RepID=UPI000E3E2B74|nr:hypothetical protein [Allorhizocola rhizosphaerae]
MPKVLKNPYVLVLIGLLSLFLAFGGAPDEAMCQGTPMQPGDTCGTLTYEQKERGRQYLIWGLTGLGLVLVLVGVRSISKRLKKKKK